MPPALEIRGAAHGLLDDPIRLRARGAGPGGSLRWRARYRDDDGRVWRASAERAEELSFGWELTNEARGTQAALRSLRAVTIEVRVDAEGGRSATRTLRRKLVGDGVRIRRWRDGLRATLHLPPEQAAGVTLIVTASGAAQTAVAVLASPLLASRGIVVLSTGEGASVDEARERLADLPGEVQTLPAVDPSQADCLGVVLPPGVGVHGETPTAAVARARAWDRLLDHLGAQPRA